MNTTRTTLRQALWRWGIPGRKRDLSAVIDMAVRVQRSLRFSRAPLAGAARIVFGATLLFAASGAFAAATYNSSVTGNWGAAATWTLGACGTAGGAGVPVAGDTVTICNTHTVTVAANAAAANVTVASGGTLSVGGITLTVSGTTSVSGTLTITNATGTKTFSGNVTVTGTWNNTAANEDVSFVGNLTNSGTFNAGTGIQTFNGAGKTVSGVTIPNMTVNGTYTNLNVGSLKVTTALAGTGTLTNQGTLQIGGTSTITTLIATAAGNIVNYNGGAAQTVRAIAYDELDLFGSGAKTMAGVTTIASILSIGGSATMTGNAAFIVGGALNYSSTASTTLNPGTAISIGSFNQTAGTLVDNGNTITVTGTGTAWTKSGTFTATGTVNFTGAAPSIGASNFNNLQISVGAGNTATLAGNITPAGNLTVSTGTLNLFWLLANRTSAGGTLTVSNGATLGIDWTNSFPTNYTTHTLGATSTVVYGGAIGGAQTVSAETYGNLTLSTSGVKTMAAGLTSIAGNLTISGTATMTGNSAFTVGGALNYSSSGSTTLTAATPISIGSFNQSNNGTFSDNGNTITVTGTGAAWTKCGTCTFTTTATSKVIFTGAAPQIGASNFNDLTIAVGAGNTATLAGTVTPAGNLTVSTGTLDLDQGIFLADRTSAGGTLSVSNGATLKIGGTKTFPANYTTHTLGATSTVNYTGTTQAVTAETYGHLTLSGSGTKTPAAGTTTVAGDFTLASGVTYAGTTNNPVVKFAGNFSNSGTFNSGTGTCTFNGSGAQTLTGATIFTNLQMNNSGAGLTINNNVTVSTLLTLTSGNITTGANVLITSATCATSVSRTSGFVVSTWPSGGLQKNIPNGASTCTFEVGSGANYTPVVLAFVVGTTLGTITASTTGSEHPSIGGSPIDSTQDVNRYWTLTNGGVGGPAFTATFNFINGSPVDFDAGADPTTFVVQRFSSPSWSAMAVNATCVATPGTNLCTQANGVTLAAGSNDFAIGQATYTSGNAGWFNVFESTTPANMLPGNIYTKIVGTAFALDVVALNAYRNAVQPGFSSNPITVDLLNASDDSGLLTNATDCRSSWPLIAGQSFSLSPAWASGRATVTIPIQANAARVVRVRVTKGTLVGCSKDKFSIRPTGFTVTSTNATQTGTSGTPVIKTGANFNLTAASVAGYDGTPSIDNTKVVGTPTAGTLGGSFGAAPVATGTATGASFFYSEVGNFGLNADAVVDTGFTNTSLDQTNGDCIASSTSNTLSGGGQYGCSIGSSAVAQTTGVSGFGRFIPDSFTVALTTPPVFGTVCGTFTYVGTRFTYATAVMTVTARNGTNNGLTNAPTVNYAGAYMKLSNVAGTSLNQAPYDTQGGRYTRFDALGGGNTPTLDTSGLPATTADPAIGAFSSGSGTLTFGPGTGFAFTRAAQVAPFNADIALALNVVDTDAVAFAGNPAAFGTATAGGGISFSGNNKLMRFGRLTIRNANGSQLVALPVQVEAQYWLGAPNNAFVTNTADNCTSIAAGNVAMSNYTNNLSASPTCETAISGGGVLSAGRRTLQLAAPGGANNGGVDLTVNLGASASGSTCTTVGVAPVSATTANFPYLQGNWTGGTYTVNPSARATFGVYKGSDEVIFIRENY